MSKSKLMHLVNFLVSNLCLRKIYSKLSHNVTIIGLRILSRDYANN